MTNKNILIPIALATLSIVCSFILYPDYLSDDAFIHIGFINGLLNGNGFCFAGNTTYGTTSPLWVILGSHLSLITHNPETSIRLLSGFFTFGSIIIFYFLLRKLKFSDTLKALGLLSLALNPFILRWSLTGMESTAVMFFMIVFLILFQKEQSINIQIYLGLLFGLSFLLRPEFIGFFSLFVLYELIRHKFNPKKIIFNLPALIILAAWLAFAFSHFGTLLPNTYTAKSSMHLLTFDMRTFSRDIQTLIAVSLPEIILIGILVPVLLIFINIEKKKYFVSKIFNKIKKSKIEIIIIWITAFYIFYILRDITVITRYAIMFAPFLILVVLFFFEAIVNHLQKVIKQSLFATYVLVIVLSSVLISFKTIKPSVDDFVNGFQSTYKDIAMIINAYSKNQKVSVGVADVGIIGAYSNARVYDSVGLVDNERFNYHSTLDYYIDKKPDFIILREEEKIEKVIPIGTGYEILFRKRLPGFGINEPEPRTVTLFKISWK